MPGVDELYVLARRVLLDAIEALHKHLDALILVGSQAIYLNVGESGLAEAPFTTDGDIAINPELLADIPPIETVLNLGKFKPKSDQSVGVWIAHHPTKDDPDRKVAVDLLVPQSLSTSKGRRSARLSGHHKRAARLVKGLEGAVVDCDMIPISALEDVDVRSFQINVAGPGAMLIAKSFKIADRAGQSRQSDKDALDVLRILRGTDTIDLCTRIRELLRDERSKLTTEKGLELLKNQFLSKSSVGVQMATRAAGLLADPDEISNSCVILTEDIFRNLA